jgi:hypothetical protein
MYVIIVLILVIHEGCLASLIFVGKVSSLPKNLEEASLGKALDFTANITLRWKGWPGKNTLVY